jgi:capping protein (actin filament) muscle Z-line, alpha
LIEDEEGKYQMSLNDTYHEMGEKTFKALRRALPMTRQKMDWDKVRCNQVKSNKFID